MKPMLSRARRAALEPRKGGLAAAATAGTSWATCFGEIDIAVPRFRQGSFRSAFLLAPKADPDAVRTAIREAATTGRSGRLLRLLGSPPLPERSVQALGAEIAHRYSASIRMRGHATG